MFRLLFLVVLPFILLLSPFVQAADPLLAGVGRADITHPDYPAKENPPWVKALVFSQGDQNAVIIALDAVAVAEIGSIHDPYLADVRSALKEKFGIAPESLLVNATHSHARVGPDVPTIVTRTVEAVAQAWENRVPVKVGAGSGHEDRVMENRRLRLKNGKEADVRHAYSLPWDEDVAAMGPIDPQIGLLRVDRMDDGRPLAVVFQFACHPIMGNPDGSNGADLCGYAAETIEANWGDGSSIALFLQGCGGDINPALYKSTEIPHDSQPLGMRLGLSALAGLRAIKPQAEAPLAIWNETLTLPRLDNSAQIPEMEKEINKLVASLRGTTLSFETFLPLYIKYHVDLSYPTEVAGRYLQDELIGRVDWKTQDENNRKAMDAYLENVKNMEELTRKQINLRLLKKHQAERDTLGPEVSAETVALRVGDFRLITFPGELTVEIGLGLKKQAPHPNTFISGYTNGYLYYTPTAEQAKNRGGAQEDSDCLMDPAWQPKFEEAALRLMKKLE